MRLSWLHIGARAFAFLLMCAGAQAAPMFALGLVDGDRTVIPEDPVLGINITDGIVYDHLYGGADATDEPNAALILTFPALAYDSYLTIDSGPVTGPLTAGLYDGSDVAPAELMDGSEGLGSGSFRGKWFVPGAFTDAFEHDKLGVQITELFLGRITHTGELSGRLRMDIAELDDPTVRTIVCDIVTTEQAEVGEGFVTHNDVGTPLAAASLGHAYVLVNKEVNVDFGEGPYKVSNLFLQAVPIPGPGMVGVLVVGGFVTAHRRR